jgi:outer membrane protein
MKSFAKILASVSALGLAAVIFCSAAAPQGQPLNIRMLNFKNCVESSKIGKQEQSSFEALKKQMETLLEEKEKALAEIDEKMRDPDYLDSLSPEAETDLKRKFRALNGEINEMQNQYYQTLQQTNFKVIQKLTETVNEAAKQVAKDNSYDLVLSEETCFFCKPELDISQQIINEMDKNFDKQEKIAGNDVKPTDKKKS